MAGQIRRLLEKIVQDRSRGDSIIANTTKAKLILKGISFDKYTSASEDDPHVIERLRQIADELGVKL